MSKENIQVILETKDGRSIRSYKHDGKTYIESHENLEYRIRIKNKTGKRIKCCIGVDSVSIITGKPITNSPEETGYIIGPHAEELFKGYRVDENTVAEFKFVKRENSYATESGEGQGNGVIAVRAFAEKESVKDNIAYWKELYEKERNKPKEYIPLPYYVRPWWDYPKYPTWYGTDQIVFKCSSDIVGAVDSPAYTYNSAGTDQNCGAINSAAIDNQTTTNVELSAKNIFSHGSSWGEAIAEKVNEIAFKVGELLEEICIYYAPLEGLKDLGVNVSREKSVAFPEPFKKEWAKPPKGWTSGQAR